MKSHKIFKTHISIYLTSFLIGLLSSVSANAQSDKADSLGGIIVYEEGGHGLIVMEKDLVSGIHKLMYWKDALDCCSKAKKNGYDDWRLPTKEELLMIWNKSGQNPEIRLKKGVFYWTSVEIDENFAWAMFTKGGELSQINKRLACYVRPVRNF